MDLEDYDFEQDYDDGESVETDNTLVRNVKQEYDRVLEGGITKYPTVDPSQDFDE